MDPLTIALIAVIAVVVLIGLFFWATYNGLVKLNVRVDEAWSDITVQLKRRYDLIPNLVNTVKGYSVHEEKAIQAVAEGKVNLKGIVTNIFELDDIQNAMDRSVNEKADIVKSVVKIS